MMSLSYFYLFSREGRFFVNGNYEAHEKSVKRKNCKKVNVAISCSSGVKLNTTVRRHDDFRLSQVPCKFPEWLSPVAENEKRPQSSLQSPIDFHPDINLMILENSLHKNIQSDLECCHKVRKFNNPESSLYILLLLFLLHFIGNRPCCVALFQPCGVFTRRQRQHRAVLRAARVHRLLRNEKVIFSHNIRLNED